MSTTMLPPGANSALSSPTGSVFVFHDDDSALDVNLTAFLLDEAGRVLGDAGLVYYNQPTGPAGEAGWIAPSSEGGKRSHRLDFDLGKLGTGLAKIAVTLTEDAGPGFASVRNLSAEIRTGGETIGLAPGAFTSEKGIVVAELYLNKGAAKVRSVWKGFDSGLSGLCRNFGVEVAEEAAAPVTPPTPQPPPAISPPNFQKVTGVVNLSKNSAPVIIEKTREITATISWKSGTDYDVYALVLLDDGRQIDVATFGADGILPLTSFDNGAVEHMGDVGRGGGEDKEEVVKIRLNERILAVVPVAYSARSNGTGSFYKYRVTMAIDNNQGTKVIIPAENANQDNKIYTCVPGMILNEPGGAVIVPLEYYSSPKSERRPKVYKKEKGNVQVVMDDGPINNYK